MGMLAMMNGTYMGNAPDRPNQVTIGGSRSKKAERDSNSKRKPFSIGGPTSPGVTKVVWGGAGGVRGNAKPPRSGSASPLRESGNALDVGASNSARRNSLPLEIGCSLGRGGAMGSPPGRGRSASLGSAVIGGRGSRRKQGVVIGAKSPSSKSSTPQTSLRRQGMQIGAKKTGGGAECSSSSPGWAVSPTSNVAVSPTSNVHNRDYYQSPPPVYNTHVQPTYTHMSPPGSSPQQQNELHLQALRHELSARIHAVMHSVHIPSLSHTHTHTYTHTHTHTHTHTRTHTTRL